MSSTSAPVPVAPEPRVQFPPRPTDTSYPATKSYISLLRALGETMPDGGEGRMQCKTELLNFLMERPEYLKRPADGRLVYTAAGEILKKLDTTTPYGSELFMTCCQIRGLYERLHASTLPPMPPPVRYKKFVMP